MAQGLLAAVRPIPRVGVNLERGTCPARFLSQDLLMSLGWMSESGSSMMLHLRS
jgi:uncharacterized membrane protein YqaE (UPF0057 family)